jgi:hypothetical protein
LLRALGSLFLWAKPKHVQKIIGEPEFISCLIQQAKENFHEVEFLDLCSCMLTSCELFYDRQAMMEPMLDLIDTLMNQGTRPRAIYHACK